MYSASCPPFCLVVNSHITKRCFFANTDAKDHTFHLHSEWFFIDIIKSNRFRLLLKIFNQSHIHNEYKGIRSASDPSGSLLQYDGTYLLSLCCCNHTGLQFIYRTVIHKIYMHTTNVRFTLVITSNLIDFLRPFFSNP